MVNKKFSLAQIGYMQSLSLNYDFNELIKPSNRDVPDIVEALIDIDEHLLNRLTYIGGDRSDKYNDEIEMINSIKQLID